MNVKEKLKIMTEFFKNNKDKIENMDLKQRFEFYREHIKNNPEMKLTNAEMWDEYVKEEYPKLRDIKRMTIFTNMYQLLMEESEKQTEEDLKTDALTVTMLTLDDVMSSVRALQGMIMMLRPLLPEED